MKKYFVTSDIHGFYNEFHTALLGAGFEEENPDHILIVCGDIFDRGSQPLELYQYLRSLPKERRILIRGNHEFLLRQMVEREYPMGHDISNRTIHTAYAIAGLDYNEERRKAGQMAFYMGFDDPDYEKKYKEFLEKCKKHQERIDKKVYHNRKIKEILKWIWSDEWVPFYELGPYIFVHAFVPTCAGWTPDGGEKYTICPNWRDYIPSDPSSVRAWEKATWDCPYKFYVNNMDSPELKDRILVAGHWHTADWWNNLEDKNYDLYEFNPIFISKKYPGLIGVDACTAATYGVNILVINEDMSCEPHNHREYTIETVTK